jgi:signal transduction histidine kinase
VILPIALIGSAVLAWWPALILRRRGSLPSGRVFVASMAAVSAWCLTSGIHALVPTLAAKIVVAKIQYLAVCSVAPLWLLLIVDYAGVAWFDAVRRRIALWTIPVLTMALAATNEWHHAVWVSVALERGRAFYTHGWWFSIVLAFNYATLVAGTVLLARTLRRSPPTFQGQAIALMGAGLAPWLGNVLYVSGTTRGFDPTSIGFTVSGLLFAWAIYRDHLFDLLPVARDVVVDGLNDAVIVLDPSRRIVDLNAAARAMIAAERYIGETVDAVLPFLRDTALEPTPDHAASLVIATEPIATYYEVRVMALHVRLRVAADGQAEARASAWAMVLRDVSAQHAAAAERDALQARFEEQQRRESLSILAGGLAHDFNNLLAAIIGNADLLAMQIPPSSEMGSSVSAILLGAQRAADLVSKMLAYAGERHGSMDRIDLDALVRELLDLLRASAGRHCALLYKGSPGAVVGDPTQLRQVVMNLILNAADAVEEGTGEIRITTGIERLTDGKLRGLQIGDDIAPGRYAFIDVHDNGCGMDEHTLRHMFDPFFTTKHANFTPGNSKLAGHGLGLAAVHGIVLGHRGALRVESDPSWGSRFRVWFPLAPEETAARPDAFALDGELVASGVA